MYKMGFPGGSEVKNLPAMQEVWVQSLGQEDPLEKGMATHSSILAWKIPWTEEPAGLQSIRWQTRLTLSLYLSSFSVTVACAVFPPFATGTVLTSPASLLQLLTTL